MFRKLSPDQRTVFDTSGNLGNLLTRQSRTAQLFVCSPTLMPIDERGASIQRAQIADRGGMPGAVSSQLLWQCRNFLPRS